MSAPVRVAIIGAGLAGLGCARALAGEGCDVTVFEKSRGVGGRVASRRIAGAILDHGTPDLVLDGDLGRELLAAYGGPDVFAVDRPCGRISRGVFTAEAPRHSVGYAGGLTQIAKRMADGLDVRLGTRIASLRRVDATIELGDDRGGSQGVADAVVVSAPAPQAAELLEQSHENGARVTRLRGVSYDPAVVVLAGLRLEDPGWWLAEPPAGPIASIAIETAKARTAIDGVIPVVARLTTDVSATLLDGDDDAVRATALPALAEALAIHEDAVAWSDVKRWRFSRPNRAVSFADANPPGTRVIVCGDVTAPGGLVGVYASGLAAASRVLSEVGR